MAYITLPQSYPMLTVLLSILSSFSRVRGCGYRDSNFIITNFVPASGGCGTRCLVELVANTGKMTAVGSVFLFIAALMLISTIDKNPNYIWRVTEKRRSAVFLDVLDGAHSGQSCWGEHCSHLICDIIGLAGYKRSGDLAPLILWFANSLWFSLLSLRSLVYTYWYRIRKSTFHAAAGSWWRHYCSNLQERLRCLYYSVPFISGDLWRVSGYPDSVCLGLLMLADSAGGGWGETAALGEKEERRRRKNKWYTPWITTKSQSKETTVIALIQRGEAAVRVDGEVVGDRTRLISTIRR